MTTRMSAPSSEIGCSDRFLDRSVEDRDGDPGVARAKALEDADKPVDIEGVGSAHPVATAQSHEFRLGKVEAIGRDDGHPVDRPELGAQQSGESALSGTRRADDADEHPTVTLGSC